MIKKNIEYSYSLLSKVPVVPVVLMVTFEGFLAADLRVPFEPFPGTFFVEEGFDKTLKSARFILTAPPALGLAANTSGCVSFK